MAFFIMESAVVFKRYCFLTVFLAIVGCGGSDSGGYGSGGDVATVAVPIVKPLYLPMSDTLPEPLRGKRVYRMGESAQCGDLEYRVNECRWVQEGLAVVDWTVTNLGNVPVIIPRIGVVRVDGMQTSYFGGIESRSEFNHDEALNPMISRSGKSYFELPVKGAFIIHGINSQRTMGVAFDCDLDQHAYATEGQ